MRKDLTVTRNMPSLWNMPDIDEMFERAFRNPLSLLDEVRMTPTVEREWFEPQVDVKETSEAYLLSVDLPGLKKEDVKVDLTDNVLTVSGERKREEEESEQDGIRYYGRMYGKFQRSLTLPTTVEAERVEASMEDGVLRIALPKFASAKPRSIQIQSGKGGFFAKLLGHQKDDKAIKQDKAH